MKVFGFHDNSASGYYRMQLPFIMLAEAGHQAQLSSHWLSAQCNEFPVIVGQRVDSTLSMWRQLMPGRKLIYEIDDDVFNVDPLNAAKVQHTPELLDQMEQAMLVSSALTVSTEHLAGVMRQHVGDKLIHVLPNYIDEKLLDVQRPQRDGLVVGWTGGDSHFRDWQMIAPVLKNLDAEIHVVGKNYAEEFGLPARWTPWNYNIFDYYRSIDFDIGIAPLAVTEFNHSKSHIKALEFAALGIPVIASDMEPYRDFVVHGETGFLAKDSREWIEHITTLTSNETLRKQMGANAKERAVDFTIQKNWQRWEQAWLGE